MTTESLPSFVNHSERLKRLLGVFEEADPKVLSLDVFDTLLYRPFRNPTDLFAEVHKILNARIARQWNLESARFVQMRIDAEREERRKDSRRETTLSRIAGKLSEILEGEVPAEWIIEAEISAEQRFIRLDRDIAALIQRARQKGVPYVLISDMYLAQEDIMGLLKAALLRAGLELPEPAAVFVSGDHGTGKAGGLFRIALDYLGMKTGEMLHVGDNLLSDVEIPSSQGLACFHYERENLYLSTVLAKEHDLDEKPDFPMDRTGGDLGLSTIRAKAFFSEGRVGCPGHFEYGAFILGPLLTLFAEWIVEDCLQRGESTIHCLMREGEFLSLLINKVAAQRGANVTAKTLWASRYALNAASYRRGDAEEIRSYFNKRCIPSLGMAAADLFLSKELLRARTGILHEHPMIPQECELFISTVVSDESLRRRVVEASALNRARLLQYYRNEGVAGRDRVTLVDLGWAGSIQERLLDLLGEEQGFSHIRGLYFATNEQVLEKKAALSSFDSFLYNRGGPMPSFWPLKRTPQILEQSCSCDKGSLRHIGENGVPSLFPSMIPKKQITETQQIQRGVLRFAELWLEGEHGREPGMHHSDRESLVADLRSILRRSLEDPRPEEAALFETWIHDDNDGSLAIDGILGSWQTKERAMKMTRSQILDLDWRECFWPAGLASLIGKNEEAESIAKNARRRFSLTLQGSLLRRVSKAIHFPKRIKKEAPSSK